MAIEINPDAHFGREFVQLHLMRLLWLDRKGGDQNLQQANQLQTEILGNFLPETVREEHRRNVVEGTVGMIVMGGGWESPAMFEFLAGLLVFDDANVLSELAMKRQGELLAAGHPSLISEEMSRYVFRVHPHIDESRDDEMDDYFAAVRKNGDEYQQHRDEFMLAKLERGEHPDTHDDFWDGYEEVPSTAYEIGSTEGRSTQAWFVVTSIAVPAGFLGLWYWTRRNSRKAA